MEVGKGFVYYYIDDDDLERKTLTNLICNNKIPYLYVYKGRTDTTILMLWVPVSDRGNGIATSLLKNIQNMTPLLSRIELDDCSDNFMKLSKNIYMKCGFRYIEDGHPEMEWISTV